MLQKLRAMSIVCMTLLLSLVLFASCGETSTEEHRGDSSPPPTIVEVVTKFPDGMGYGSGQGTLHSEDTVLTCRHVIDGAKKAWVYTDDGFRHEVVSVVNDNELMDLVLIRIDPGVERVSTPRYSASEGDSFSEAIVLLMDPEDHTKVEALPITLRAALNSTQIGHAHFLYTDRIVPGHSGAPVVTPGREDIVGMVALVNDDDMWILPSATSARSIRSFLAADPNEMPFGMWQEGRGTYATAEHTQLAFDLIYTESYDDIPESARQQVLDVVESDVYARRTARKLWIWCVYVHFWEDDMETVVDVARAWLEIAPDDCWMMEYLYDALLALGKYEEAAKVGWTKHDMLEQGDCFQGFGQ